MKAIRSFSMLLLFIALVSLMAAPHTAQAQTQQVTPEVGPPGSQFVFYAEGFQPNEKIGVWINAHDGTVISVVDSKGEVLVVQADDTGLAEWFVVMPEETPDGFYTMVARGISSVQEYTIPFQVSTGTPALEGWPPPPGATATVEPPAGPAGTRFIFTAEGFKGNEDVGVWINAPDGSVISLADSEGGTFVAKANDNGVASWTATLASGTPPGFYTMVAQGIDSGILHTIPFEIQ